MREKQERRESSGSLMVNIIASETTVKLTYVDVERDQLSPTIWKELRLYTEREYPSGRFSELSLSPKEYEEIGFNIVNRLCALANLGSASKRSSKTLRRKRG